MPSKYDSYLSSECCEKLLSSEYASIIENIINEDELLISEDLKRSFFEYLAAYDSTVSSINDYVETGLDHPVGITDFATKQYLFKGKVINSLKDTELGRATNRNGFRYNFNTTLLLEYAKDPSATVPVSNPTDERIINSLTIETDEVGTAPNVFYAYVRTSKIAQYKIQSHLMWSFESINPDNALEGPFDLKDLPCILGLPGPKGTSEGYNTTKRLAFAFRLNDNDVIKKPTCFDAGLMPVWQPGGKTRVHDECNGLYGTIGFEEYVNVPITFGQITSNIVSL